MSEINYNYNHFLKYRGIFIFASPKTFYKNWLKCIKNEMKT